MDFQKNIALLIVIIAIFSGLLGPVLSFDFAFATSEEEGVENTGNGGDDSSDNGDSSDEPEPEPEPEPPPLDPCEENPDAEGCTPEPPGPPDRDPPDDDCLFDPSLPKCVPIDGKCPDGFLMNENEQCFPDKPCPTGFEKRDEDETGRCYPIPTPEPTPTPTPTPIPTPTPTPALSIADSSLQVSTNKKIYNLEEMVTITVKNNGNGTLWLPNGVLGVGIKNLDTGKSYGIIATQALVPLEPGESKSIAWDQKDGGEDGDQLIAKAYF